MDMNINRPADTAAGQRRKEKVYLITAVIVLICIAVSRIGIGVHNKAELKKICDCRCSCYRRIQGERRRRSLLLCDV